MEWYVCMCVRKCMHLAWSVHTFEGMVFPHKCHLSCLSSKYFHTQNRRPRVCKWTYLILSEVLCCTVVSKSTNREFISQMGILPHRKRICKIIQLFFFRLWIDIISKAKFWKKICIVSGKTLAIHILRVYLLNGLKVFPPKLWTVQHKCIQPNFGRIDSSANVFRQSLA